MGESGASLEVAVGRVLDLVAEMLHIPAKTFSGAAGTDCHGGKGQSQQAEAGTEGMGTGGRFHGCVGMEDRERMDIQLPPKPSARNVPRAYPPHLLLIIKQLSEYLPSPARRLNGSLPYVPGPTLAKCQLARSPRQR